jgi:DUF4097 and DUF4098 domain-containing protein YvlB
MLNTKRIAVLGVLLLIIGAAGAFLTYPSMAEMEQKTEEHVFAEEIRAVHVDTDNSKIEIMPSPDSTAKVEFEIPGRQNEKYNLDAIVENGVLEVKVKEKMLQFFNFDFNLKSFMTRVYLPEETYEAITVQTDNGAIIMEEITALSVEAGSTNGTITLALLDAEKITVHATNGMIDFKEVQAALHAETTNGQIKLQAETTTQPIDFETVNGKINIELDAEPGNAEIRAEVVNGKVDIFGENSSHRTFGTGENQVNLQTVNGSITMKQVR